MERILFITATRIGDAVLNSGVLDHLVRTRPKARFTIACGPLAQPFMEETPRLERLIAVRKRPFDLHWLGLWRRVAFRKWDLVVDLRGSALAWLVWARQREVKKKSRIVTHKVREAAGVLRVDPPPPPRLYIPEDAHERIAKLIPADRPVLALCPSAAFAAKTWPGERFAELAARLTGPDGPLAGALTVILGGPGDEAAAQPVIEALPEGAVFDLTGKLDLRDVAACLARARLFAGNDSGLMHIAAAMGAPALGLFGPTDERFYGPWGENCAAVRGPMGYEEIQKSVPRWRRSPDSLVMDLSVDAAFEAASRLLKRTERKAA
ncbi:MAG: glycosyltransferase family 9 protein [Maricaulaceae bacterium]|nr:glycosyltransferase family 9 protein [Maricaulaceae bacterium]